MQKNRNAHGKKKQHLLSVLHIFARSFLKKQKESNAFFAFQSLERRATPDGRSYLSPSIQFLSFELLAIQLNSKLVFRESGSLEILAAIQKTKTS